MRFGDGAVLCKHRTTPKAPNRNLPEVVRKTINDAMVDLTPELSPDRSSIIKLLLTGQSGPRD
ncbi:Uncharacterized protein APZ42_009004 [Daphnia magna]|uniref:Uncharacterized protein n=1 Tax=Daphnia magna TaxID=35525 RepID=A0A164E9X9_9CRUS|nr:Uncharacterized protein APZ42_009004 [Daphnia magna]